jgi:hypothetical protein
MQYMKKTKQLKLQRKHCILKAFIDFYYKVAELSMFCWPNDYNKLKPKAKEKYIEVDKRNVPTVWYFFFSFCY